MQAEAIQAGMSFEEFRRLVAQELGIPVELVVAKALFLEDLQADSVQLVDLFLRFQENGMEFPLEAAWQIRTVGDAYQLYLESARTGSVGPLLEPGLSGGC